MMISTHILDTTKGMPARDVAVSLERHQQGHWITIGEDKTNADGRIVFDCPREAGTYRLTFMIEEYFQGEASFFLNTPVIFKIEDTARKYHVPLLLNPYGYSTYRGS
jgi:5-hydroxyisourate hydrolase